MNEKSSTQKVCSFYVSNMHFATMILPFVNKQKEEKTEIITFLENNFTTNIELVLSRLTIPEERKRELLDINWRDTDVEKYLTVEKILKAKINKDSKNIIIINGKEEYINLINNWIERYIQKHNKKLGTTKIKIINFYEVGSFNENVKEILEKHEMIFNTAGEHRIEEIFEDFKKEEEKINA